MNGTDSEVILVLRADAPIAAARLGESLLAELDWRGVVTSSASRGAGLLALPPDPGARVGSLRLSELALPARGTVAEGRLRVRVRAACCEAAVAVGRWEDVDRHARAALANLQALRRADAADADAWARWRELCFSHLALVASHRLAEQRSESAAAELTVPKPAGSFAPAAAAACVASHRALLRQLQDYCARRELAGSTAASRRGVDAVLRLVEAAAACAMDAPGVSAATLRVEALRTLAAALRCALRELAPADGTPIPPLPAALSLASLGADIVRMLGKLLLSAAEAAPPRAHRTASAGATDAWIDGAASDDADDGAEPERPDALPRKRARTTRAEVGASTRAALLRCGTLAAGLLSAAARDEPGPGFDASLRVLDVCLPDAAFTSAPAEADETRRALADALHARANCRTAEVLALATAEAASSSSVRRAHHAHAWGDGDADSSGGSSDDVRLLRAAERDASRAAALRAARPPSQPGLDMPAHAVRSRESLDLEVRDGEDAAAAIACRRTWAVLLMLLGRVADAAAQMGPTHDARRRGTRHAALAPPSASVPTLPLAIAGCDDATVLGVLRACDGDMEGSLEALQHALAVGSDRGQAAALPLYNLLSHYDRQGQSEAALQLAEFLGGADFGGAAAVRSAIPRRSCEHLAVHGKACARSGSAAVHDASALLCPTTARYLRARAHLRTREWGASRAALRAFLDEERALRPVLRALGLDERDVLRQLALAMLNDGEHHELLELVRDRGAHDGPHLADLVADALFCEGEVAAALATSEVALDAALQSDLGGSTADVRTALRARNNRACYLAANARPSEAERELLAAVRLAPKAIEPAYNLALLRWQVGERRRAAEGWLRFRGWPLAATPDFYTRIAESVQPGEDVAPPVAQSAVDAASAATLDREVLRHWAAMRGEEESKRHWT